MTAETVGTRHDSTPREALKAPFPYFGGKRRIARCVWRLLGDVKNYIEPFFGSGAVLLCRPHPASVETINDADCFVANFWRAVQADPAGVVPYCDGPINEADQHARHRWLVFSEDAAAWRERMAAEPDFYDSKIAGWWVWGLSMWIGSGWCSTNPRRTGGEMLSKQMPNISHRPGASGVHRISQKRFLTNNGGSASGVHRQPQQVPDLTCADRRAWLLDWFGRLCDRLRNVRVCCGDWSRVCGSWSVTMRLGTTGVFLDPPYSVETGRSAELYARDSGSVAHDVRDWCLEWGTKSRMRIVLCGLEGEHNALEDAGWRVEAWTANGGYGNQGKTNIKRTQERLWISPGCVREKSLFDAK